MPGDFERLAQLASADAPGFIRLRRALIDELITRPEFDGGRLAALQREIDCRRASALAPRQALEAVTQLLEERVADLQVLSERLAQLNAASSA
ncbi:MAG TPA: DUF3135 domain-containing protein [Azonexus sp.]|nr:DUF3135 domain-containing protein [Azonexus sp.]